MIAMKEYIIGLAVATLVCGLITSLTGGGGSGEGLRTVCGICVIAVIALPLVSLIGNGGFDVDGIAAFFETDPAETDHYDEIYNSCFAQAEVENAEKRLKSEMIQELSLKSEHFDVALIVGENGDEKFIERAEVIIYAQGLSIDPHSVEKYIKSRLNCPCEIIYEL